MREADPLGSAEFAELMRAVGPFGAARNVVVGVSGGADSMALATLLARWGRPFAVIVDHGLRVGSATEAALTRGRLDALAIASVVRCADLRPGPAQSERARAARYRLLLDICRERGCPDLLVAHHATDQAETVRMRLDAGSGPAGLAGMAPIAFRPEARLLRPLLAVEPARLRATLRQAGVTWVEDPSNRDPATARGRLRQAGEGATPVPVSGDSSRQRAALEREAAAELARVRIAPEGFAVVPERLGPAALSALIWTLSGRPYPPPRASLAAGLAARTIHGVLLRPAGRLGPGTLLTREPGLVAATAPARSGMVWDGRFRLEGTVPPGLSIGALGSDAPAFRSRSPLPAIVLAGLPALRRDGAIWAVPHLGFPDAATCRSVQVRFWPSRPVALSWVDYDSVNPSEGRGV